MTRDLRHKPPSYHLFMTAGVLSIVRSPAYSADEIARYRATGWWSDSTLSDAVRRNAAESPDRVAYLDVDEHRGRHPDAFLTWREFDAAATSVAEQLAGCGVARGDRIAVWHGDSAAIHVLFIAVERCGAVVVGIGARAGTREATQLLHATRPKILISDQPRSAASTAAAADKSIPVMVFSHDGKTLGCNTDVPPRTLAIESQLGPDDVFLINSTSGTTGLPKCVVHTQNRWHYFHQKAVANGLLTSDDVILPVIPMPFGFGIWTS